MLEQARAKLVSLPGLTDNRILWLLGDLFLVSLLARAAFRLIVWGVDAGLEGDELAYHGFAASFVDGDGWQYGDGPVVS